MAISVLLWTRPHATTRKKQHFSSSTHPVTSLPCVFEKTNKINALVGAVVGAKPRTIIRNNRVVQTAVRCRHKTSDCLQSVSPRCLDIILGRDHIRDQGTEQQTPSTIVYRLYYVMPLPIVSDTLLLTTCLHYIVLESYLPTRTIFCC